jgi:hypothetical protein
MDTGLHSTEHFRKTTRYMMAVRNCHSDMGEETLVRANEYFSLVYTLQSFAPDLYGAGGLVMPCYTTTRPREGGMNSTR